MNKVYSSAQQAIQGLSDHMTLLVGGFGLSGNPENLIEAVHQSGRVVPIEWFVAQVIIPRLPSNLSVRTRSPRFSLLIMPKLQNRHCILEYMFIKYWVCAIRFSSLHGSTHFSNGKRCCQCRIGQREWNVQEYFFSQFKSNSRNHDPVI